MDAVNLDLDGFFELLILGTMGAAIGHTMATTLVGPMIFGRILCGRACWRAMVLELLPIGRGAGRRRGVWASLSFVGLAASIAAATLCALLWPIGGVKLRKGCSRSAVMRSDVAGLYYGSATGAVGCGGRRLHRDRLMAHYQSKHVAVAYGDLFEEMVALSTELGFRVRVLGGD